MKCVSIQKISGNQDYCMILKTLRVKIMLCSKLHCQKYFELKHVSYKIQVVSTWLSRDCAIARHPARAEVIWGNNVGVYSGWFIWRGQMEKVVAVLRAQEGGYGIQNIFSHLLSSFGGAHLEVTRCKTSSTAKHFSALLTSSLTDGGGSGRERAGGRAQGYSCARDQPRDQPQYKGYLAHKKLPPPSRTTTDS